jgi:hypothetical protein
MLPGTRVLRNGVKDLHSIVEDQTGSSPFHTLSSPRLWSDWRLEIGRDDLDLAGSPCKPCGQGVALPRPEMPSFKF